MMIGARRDDALLYDSLFALTEIMYNNVSIDIF